MQYQASDGLKVLKDFLQEYSDRSGEIPNDTETEVFTKTVG